MKTSASKITDSELEIMQVLWQAAEPLPQSEIRQRLQAVRPWDSSTVKTLLRRLCDKEAVGSEQREVLYFRPLVSEEAYHAYATRRLIDRLYSGSAKKLVAALVQEHQLDDGDIAELRAMFKVGEDNG